MLGRTVPKPTFTQNQENTVDPLRRLMTAVLALPVVACAALGSQHTADAKPAERRP